MPAFSVLFRISNFVTKSSVGYGLYGHEGLPLKLKLEASTTQTAHMVLCTTTKVEDLKERDVSAGMSLDWSNTATLLSQLLWC